MSLLKASYLLLGFLAGSLVSHAGQPVVTMNSGERLIGEVVSAQSNETTLVLNSELLGQLGLPRAQIASEEPLQAEQANPETPSAAKPDAAASKAANQVIPLSDEEIALMLDESLIDKFIKLKTPDSWTGNLRFGLDLSSGDSRWQQLYTKGNLVIDPQQSPNYYRFTGSYTYRTTERNGETVKSTDRYDANFTYRRDALGPFFLQNSIGGRVDEVKGINHEVQEMVGLGLRVQPTERLKFIVGAGGGIEDYDPDFEDTRSGINPVANFFQELTWRPFEKATLAQEFNYFINTDDTEQYNYVFSTSLRYRFTDLLGFEVAFDQNFDNDVGNGNVRDDTRWRNALIVYF